ncbi:MAG: carbohydrate kinase, partial [Solirubrobacterales bacterium]|nr:carbohydrate kinase [Solirubrobacterales bacterium]
MHALCVDVGTSVIKCVVYDGDGREVAVARTPTTTLRSAPGHAGQDMDAVWDGVVRSVREASQGLGAEIGLVACTAQGDGCWLVDDAGRPVGPAALWSDGRSAGIVERWHRDGTIERAFRINGSMTFPGLPNALLHWLREHEPERLARAHKALYCGGWIFLRLTGEFAVDESDASAPLLDIRTRAYSHELMELFDLEWAAPLLPEVRAAGQPVGSLSQAAAVELS